MIWTALLWFLSAEAGTKAHRAASNLRKNEWKWPAEVFCHSIAAATHAYVTRGKLLRTRLASASLRNFMNDIFALMNRSKAVDSVPGWIGLTREKPHAFIPRAIAEISTWNVSDQTKKEMTSYLFRGKSGQKSAPPFLSKCHFLIPLLQDRKVTWKRKPLQGGKNTILPRIRGKKPDPPVRTWSVYILNCHCCASNAQLSGSVFVVSLAKKHSHRQRGNTRNYVQKFAKEECCII